MEIFFDPHSSNNSKKKDASSQLILTVEELDRIAENAKGDLRVDTVLISLAQSNKLHSVGAFPFVKLGDPGRHHAMADTVCAHTLEKKGVLILENAKAIPEFSDLKYVSDGSVTGYLGTPIFDKNGNAVGAVCSITNRPRKWALLEKNYMNQIARNVE